MNKTFVGYGRLVVNRITSKSVSGYIEKQYQENGTWKDHGRLVSGLIPTTDKVFVKWDSVAQAQNEADQFGARFINKLKD